jgi:hypothetical protein
MLTGGGLMYLWFREKRTREGNGFGSQRKWFLGTMAVAGTLLSGILAAGIWAVLSGKTALSGFIYAPPESDPTNALLPVLIGLLILFVMPLTLVINGMVYGFRRKIPVSVAIIRTVQKHAFTQGSVLLWVYVSLVLVVWYQERQLIPQIKASVTHEGRHMAQLAGTEWPGFVPAGK